MSSKKETKTESSQTRDPWAPAQPFIMDVMNQAKKTFNSDAGSQYYPNSTVVPYSDETNQAMDMMKNRAINGSPVTTAAKDQLINTMNGGMFGANPANDTYQNFASGGQGGNQVARGVFGDVANQNGDFSNVRDMADNFSDPSKSFYTGMKDGNLQNNTDYSNFTGPQNTPANEYLTATARGDMVGNNPYLDKTFDKISSKVSDSLNSTFAKSGRYGSEAHQGTLTENLGGIANDLYGSAYAQERANQMNAANSLQGAFDTDMSRRMGATDRESALTEANFGRQISGAQLGSNSNQNEAATKMQAEGLFGNLNAQNTGQRMQAAGALENGSNQDRSFQLQGAQGLSNDFNQERQNQMRSMFFAPQAANQDYFDIGQLSKVGTMNEAKDGQYLQDDMNRFNFQQQNPWDRLAQYSNLALGYGSAGGQSNGTSTTVQKTSGLGPIMGGVMGGLNMASQMYGGGMFGGGAPGGGAQSAMSTPSMVPNNMAAGIQMPSMGLWG